MLYSTHGCDSSAFFCDISSKANLKLEPRAVFIVRHLLLKNNYWKREKAVKYYKR